MEGVGGDARDCCARICNSRSICKRQRNLNREECLYLSFELPHEIRGFCCARCGTRVGIIYTANKNHRSLENSSTQFYSRRQHLRFPAPIALGMKSGIEFRKWLAESLNWMMRLL